MVAMTLGLLLIAKFIDVLFDLELDPAEQENVYDESPEVAARLTAHLSGRAQTAGGEAGFQGAEVELDEAEREELRALGYVP